MRTKQTITLEQSKNTTKVQITTRHAEQQHNYTVVKLQGTTEPAIGSELSKRQVEELIRKPNTTVNINPKK